MAWRFTKDLYSPKSNSQKDRENSVTFGYTFFNGTEGLSCMGESRDN